MSDFKYLNRLFKEYYNKKKEDLQLVKAFNQKGVWFYSLGHTNENDKAYGIHI